MMRSSLLRLSKATPARTFATTAECAPAQKLRDAFALYRKEHFSRETPVRFRKEFAKAFTPYCDKQKDALMAEDLNTVLAKIGMSDKKLSADELDALVQEAGVPDTKQKMLSVSKIMQLTLSNTSKTAAKM